MKPIGCVHKFHHVAELNVIGSARIVCLCLFNAEVEDYSSSALDSIKRIRNDSSQAQKFLETSLDLIRKRQKLIKLADKSDAGWLVVQEYELEELADDSEDEKRIKKA